LNNNPKGTEGTQELILWGRSPDKLSRLKQDLQARKTDCQMTTDVFDFCDPVVVQQKIDQIKSSSPIDLVIIAQGVLSDQEACQKNLKSCHDSLVINGISPVLFLESFVSLMQTQTKGHIAIIGSVAGDRGKKSNYIYGAAKGLLERYVEGVQHRLATQTIFVSLIKPGPTDTPMTQHLQQTKGLKVASVEEVAQVMMDGVARQKRVIYAPKKWRIIMWVIRHLPFFIFKHLNI
jgi:short-subunit dehydrogenase